MIMKLSKNSHATWFDKVPSKTADWNKDDHLKAGFRYVPNAVVRKSAFIAKGSNFNAKFCKFRCLCR